VLPRAEGKRAAAGRRRRGTLLVPPDSGTAGRHHQRERSGGWSGKLLSDNPSPFSVKEAVTAAGSRKRKKMRQKQLCLKRAGLLLTHLLETCLFSAGKFFQ